MKRRFVAFLLLGLLAYAVGLVAGFPAARALTLVHLPGVEAAGVSGSVWHGTATRLALRRNLPLTDVRWDVEAWRLLAGRVAADLHFKLAGTEVRGRFSRAPGGALEVDDTTVSGPVAGLADLAPGSILALAGQVRARIDRARIEDGRPRSVQGRFEWTDARVTAPLGLDLGTVHGRMEPGDDGAQRLELKAEGGQLRVSGDIRLLASGQYRVDLRLVPAPDAPDGLSDTLSLFARRSGDGAFVVRRSGRLSNLGTS